MLTSTRTWHLLTMLGKYVCCNMCYGTRNILSLFQGFVMSEEEVSDMLVQMIDNKIIREYCRVELESNRLAITKELGLIQKDRPWIAITVKTKQAIRSTLNNIRESIIELKISGMITFKVCIIWVGYYAVCSAYQTYNYKAILVGNVSLLFISNIYQVGLPIWI